MFGAVSISLVLHVVLVAILSCVCLEFHPSGLDIIFSLVVESEEPAIETMAFEPPAGAENRDGAGANSSNNGFSEDSDEVAQSLFKDSSRESRLRAIDSTSAMQTPADSFDGAGNSDNPFGGRSRNGRGARVVRRGGTVSSELAVEAGLVWLKNQQHRDGSWCFYSPDCNCALTGEWFGYEEAATALAVLAFLGAGHSHVDGDYQQEVGNGLTFLLESGRQASVPVKGSQRALRGIRFERWIGRSYHSNALVTTALSEAFAMTGDERLRPAITGAIEFLVSTQEQNGSWRDSQDPQWPCGNTVNTAFQMTGLKSAQSSGFDIPSNTFERASQFLESVALEQGSQYSLVKNQPALQFITAMGLLCRIQLGSTEDDAGLRAGIRYLDESGPDTNNILTIFFGTQVMYHWGGPEWKKWNNAVRDWLVATQISNGDQKGSWEADRYCLGVRLQKVTMSLLTLEIYDRFEPLLRRGSAKASPNTRAEKSVAE